MAKFNLDNYETVEDRLKKYWEENPHGKIETDVVHITDDGNCVTIKASVYIHAMTDVGDHTLILKTTGIAQETKGQGGFANADAWMENCETSAIGRALANLDMYNKNKDRASYEEMKAAELMDRSGGSQTSGSEPSSPPKLNNPGGTPSPRQTNYIRAFADAGILVKEEYFDENDNILLTAQGASDLMGVVFKGGEWNKFVKENPEKAQEIANNRGIKISK